MRPHRHSRSASAALAALLLSTAPAGCAQLDRGTEVAAEEPRGTEAGSTGGSAVPTAPAPAGGSPSQAPSPTPTTAPEQTEQQSSSPARPTPATQQAAAHRSLPERLLDADQVPALEEQRWKDGRTRGVEGRDPFATCHKFAMTSIGATRVAVREYLPRAKGSPATASALVAQFPDVTTAQRAYSVLAAWRGQCEEELGGYERHDVGPLRAVSVPDGVAARYLLSYGPADGDADAGFLDAQGLTRVGARVAVLQMRQLVEDGASPDGTTPIAALTRRASALL